MTTAALHFADCDTQALGRLAAHWAATEASDTTLGATIRDAVTTGRLDGFRPTCACYGLHITRIKGDITRIRAAGRAYLAAGNEVGAAQAARSVRSLQDELNQVRDAEAVRIRRATGETS